MDNKTVYDASEDAKMEDRSKSEVLRDNESNKVLGYKFEIQIREKPTLKGEFTRDEMNKVYSLYSSEGANLTQRSVSREFPEYTFQDFKRILRAFNITKASVPFAPHMFEEHTVKDLEEMSMRIKENTYLKKLEQDRRKLSEDRLKDLTKEYIEYKEKTKDLEETLKNLDINIKVEVRGPKKTNNKTIVVYLSDMHIGASVSETESLYRNVFNYEEAKRRFSLIFHEVTELADTTKATNIVVCNIGDSLDGYNGETTRGGHKIPQNMNNREQLNNYVQLMTDFFASILSCGSFNSIKYYCVATSNHRFFKSF